jgi:(R,R)-butanediol dehydrogenase / meso-butanediol dehydrogenase / diacetyl reductase
MPLAYCGHCAYCRRGLQHLCATMACVGLSHAWGGMGELATVAEYQIVRLPDSVSYEQGALIEPTAVAAYGVERAGVAPGDRVLVTGAGPIGALAALCAHAAGASTVYISEPNPARRARAEALGVAAVLDPTSVDVPELLHEQTDGLGVDVAIECSGHPNGFNAAVRSLRRRGTLAQTGLFVGEASVEPMLWSLNDLTIVGTWCYWVYDFERIAAQIGAGSLPVERVVTSSVTLDGAPDAFARLASGAADEIKVLVGQ